MMIVVGSSTSNSINGRTVAAVKRVAKTSVVFQAVATTPAK
jgi:hypothetical protein